MKKLKCLQVRLESDDFKKVKLNAQMMGFRFTSDYIRFVTINHNADLYLKVRDIHNSLIGKIQNIPLKSKQSKKERETNESLDIQKTTAPLPTIPQ